MRGKKALVQKSPSQYTALVFLFTESYILEGRIKDENCRPRGKTQVQREFSMTTVARVELYHLGIPLPAPFQPGLGFTINQRALRKYGQRYFVMDRKRLVWFSLRTPGIKASKEIDRVRRERRAQSSRASS